MVITTGALRFELFWRQRLKEKIRNVWMNKHISNQVMWWFRLREGENLKSCGKNKREQCYYYDEKKERKKTEENAWNIIMITTVCM